MSGIQLGSKLLVRGGISCGIRRCSSAEQRVTVLELHGTLGAAWLVIHGPWFAPEEGDIMATVTDGAQPARVVADAALQGGHHELHPLLKLALTVHWEAQAAHTRRRQAHCC